MNETSWVKANQLYPLLPISSDITKGIHGAVRGDCKTLWGSRRITIVQHDLTVIHILRRCNVVCDEMRSFASPLGCNSALRIGRKRRSGQVIQRMSVSSQNKP